ncbi:MAG: hypothetical protein QNL05_05445 [Gammaproteobacteria bacterium]|nr:hypothetical protein [Gammaproteobacteria bacterium]
MQYIDFNQRGFQQLYTGSGEYMVNAVTSIIQPRARHQAMLLTPWYARQNKDEQQPQVHEYLETNFMELFADDLQNNKLKASRHQAWYTTNKLDGKVYPVLRQPIHQGYYLACSELTCDIRSRAPLDPNRLREAWMLVTPYGESSADKNLQDKLAKPLLQAFLLQAKDQGNAYPMRPVVTQDAKGQNHTILSGFVPLADIFNRDENEPPQNEQQLNNVADEMAASFVNSSFSTHSDQLLWNGTSVFPRLQSLLQLLDENLAIGVVQGQLAYTAANQDDNTSRQSIESWKDWLKAGFFYEIPQQNQNRHLNSEQQQLRVRRNQLVSNLPLNPPLPVTADYRNAYSAFRQALLSIAVPSLTLRELKYESRYHFTAERIAVYTTPWLDYISRLSTLLDKLRIEMIKPANMLGELSGLRSSINTFNTRLNNTRSAAQALDLQFQPRHKYRRKSLLQWLLSDRNSADEEQSLSEQLPVNQILIVSADWVRRGAPLIRRRWLELINSLSQDWQTGQKSVALKKDDDQLYQLQIFAKVVDDRGCEYLIHSQHGEPFYIASFYETRLMPTYPIKMPTLKDLKKAVSGPALIMPSDLAGKVNKLKFPDGKVEKSGSGGSGRWIYVFSIPIVTICSMILLMLMINILNFIFRWIPFAILRIPFPK